ncbi:potassium transporter 7-like isoform X8 [Zingiber officinale]|uniref:potassium transporter 7-like isoform X8 n=1 Tax=Zingiber officinale TaxID=94328 RepID=UPI001C4CEF1E|nr:potassium transporter 7-like isoform X8 [Zingiber officinale]
MYDRKEMGRELAFSDTSLSLPWQVSTQFNRRSCSRRFLLLAYQSFGVVYGDLATSPIYVYTNSFLGRLNDHRDEETVLGVFSLIFWTFTLIPLIKYAIIVLGADDNGEGGPFALYSLLCRHAKISLLPNQQAVDEELSTYYRTGYIPQNSIYSPLKRFLENHRNLHTCLLVSVLFGACMVIGDGVLTPAISVRSSISGLQVKAEELLDGEVVFISCIVLVSLFALQHKGTQRSTGIDGWISLGGIVLSVTGTEAMFADLGHFNTASVRVAFLFVIYPCLVLQYMGQAAFLSKNISDVTYSFFESIPELVYWPVFVLSTLAAIVASQSVITATFSIVKQCHSLGCFPRVKIVHTSKWIRGQVYIPEINWILMVLCLAVTLGLRDTTAIGNAYGVAIVTVMFVTTLLMTLVIVFVWRKRVIFALFFLAFFGLIEVAYLSSSLVKVRQGGWVSFVLSSVFMVVMYVWHYGTCKKYLFDLQNKVPMKWILTLGPSLGIVRVPGIGLIYTQLVTDVPPIFSHFVTNLPAFHQVLVFVSIKSVPIPYVPPGERHLIGRIGPRMYKMYRCIIRYGYKDVQDDGDNFENQLISSIAKFIQMEALESSSERLVSSPEGRMVVVPATNTCGIDLVIGDSSESSCCSTFVTNGESTMLQSIEPLYEEQESTQSSNQRSVQFELSGQENINSEVNCRRVQFELHGLENTNSEVKEELEALLGAKQAGIAYIVGHSYVKAMKSSSFLKKIVIDYAYSFLRKNCRAPTAALNIPHTSLIEVGMIYYV